VGNCTNPKMSQTTVQQEIKESIFSQYKTENQVEELGLTIDNI
jgi:hypothetical protein